MNLHENKALYRPAIEFASSEMQIPAIYIEKDYWVTFVLYSIFNHEIGRDTIFKGGTALSKYFNLIQRFSEDIDLVVLRREGESNNKLTSKIKGTSKLVSDVLPEVDAPGITQKMGMNRKTAHVYNKEFDGKYGQVRDVIVVEATWLGYFEPYTKVSLSSLVGEMMLNNGQHELATQLGMMPFEVLALAPERTICEKIMSLVRFSHSDQPILDLQNKIRHAYDLHQLLSKSALLDFFQSANFDKMLLKVAHDDVQSFKNNNSWLVVHPSEALIFRELETVWKELKPEYEGNFKFMLYGEIPSAEQIFETLRFIKERLKTISWSVKI